MKKRTNTDTTPNVVNIDLNLIQVSAFNYRYQNEKVVASDLLELASSIKEFGVIQPIVVRAIENEQFEVVVGERRYRASKLAKIVSIPAIIKELSDEEVQEMQVIENLQRENPHPITEAEGIAKFLSFTTKKYTIEDIAKRIGKSASYVYQRIKLISLIEPLKAMYRKDVLTTIQALKLARLDEATQLEFFNENCEDWESEEDFEINNFEHQIDNYELELSKAPFNPKNGKLDSKAGACTNCAFNTATTKSLFPEEESSARCTNRSCYDNKCNLQGKVNLVKALKDNPNTPLATNGANQIFELIDKDNELISNRVKLEYNVGYFDTIDIPDAPDSDYDQDDEDELNDYQENLAQYNEELAEFENDLKSGKTVKAIWIGEDSYSTKIGQIVYVVIEKIERSNYNTSNKVEIKAKDYQEARKTKTLTPEIIENEKQRLLSREERAVELDAEKLQLVYHSKLAESEAVSDPGHKIGKADASVLNYLLFEELGYQEKRKFVTIISGKDYNEINDTELVERFNNFTKEEVMLMVRMNLLKNSNSKNPKSLAGMMLRKLVDNTKSIDIATEIESSENTTKQRLEMLEEKISKL
jgi:ParB family transcriptional regulator, chromosome partitioning protein